MVPHIRPQSQIYTQMVHYPNIHNGGFYILQQTNHIFYSKKKILATMCVCVCVIVLLPTSHRLY